MEYKIDLSAHLLSNDDAIAAARLSVRDETIDKAVRVIAERNERTAEQATILAQHEEIARLRAELEAARVDAERYRFIRGGESWLHIRERGTVGSWPLIGQEADAAIDAARGGK